MSEFPSYYDNEPDNASYAQIFHADILLLHPAISSKIFNAQTVYRMIGLNSEVYTNSYGFFIVLPEQNNWSQSEESDIEQVDIGWTEIEYNPFN